MPKVSVYPNSGGMQNSSAIFPSNMTPSLRRSRSALIGKIFNYLVPWSPIMQVANYADNEEDRRGNIERINEFSLLTNNWDGNRALSIDRSVILVALEVIERIDYQPEVFPGPEGLIQLEYDKKDGRFMELQIRKDRYEVFTVNDQNEEVEYVGPLVADEIVCTLDNFMKD